MADGIFTPAVSVTSAVSGIGVAQPSVLDSLKPISIVGDLLYWERVDTDSQPAVHNNWIFLLATVWNHQTLRDLWPEYAETSLTRTLFSSIHIQLRSYGSFYLRLQVYGIFVNTREFFVLLIHPER
jgi:hypothetical protein